MKAGIFKYVFLIVLLSWCNTIDSQNVNDIKYQRSSVISMMIEHPMYMFNEEIAASFASIAIPSRFNDHNLGVKVVKFASQEFSDQQDNISSFLEQVDIGNRAIAKWFNWNKLKKSFDMELIKERGLYNANALERDLAEYNIRGSAILADAGENLIPNTYFIMSDICYRGKYSNKEKEMYTIGSNHKFNVNIVSYIFQIDWNRNLLEEFYNNFYNNPIEYFADKNKYHFIFKAKVESDYGESSNKISQNELIKKVVARALDMNFAKLQTAYPDFRIKALVTSVFPIQADIGLKEGVNGNNLYEVLEMNVADDGLISYNRIGVIKPVEGKIWDNRYMAEMEDTPSARLGATTFEIVSGSDFYPGLLIREIE